MARPKTKHIFTRDLVEEIARLVGLGVPVTMACAHKRVKYESFNSALRRDEELAEIYAQGKADQVVSMVERMAAGEKYSSGLQFILERRFPDHFRRPVDPGKQGNVNLVALPGSQVALIQQVAGEMASTNDNTYCAKQSRKSLSDKARKD